MGTPRSAISELFRTKSCSNPTSNISNNCQSSDIAVKKILHFNETSHSLLNPVTEITGNTYIKN